MERVTKFAWTVLVLGLPLLVGCDDGKVIGQHCQAHNECDSSLQCLGGTCTSQCHSDAECGDGYLCGGGLCEAVVSQIGDGCDRERDCGPGQTCLVSQTDSDGNGVLAATCAAQGPGGVLGTVCSADADCRSGSCNLSRCSEVCQNETDCDGAYTCTAIPRIANDGPALFRGCLQEGGALEISLPISASHALTTLPVPGNARSFAITARASDPLLKPGVSLLATPTGAVWYRTPLTLEDYLDNPVRYQPAVGESTLLAPNRPGLTLVPGSYPLRVGTSFANDSPAQEVPTVRVVYKLNDGAVLDVNVYVLNLDGHPCSDSIGATALDAENAGELAGIRIFEEQLRAIFRSADIELGELRYQDVKGRPELDLLEQEDLPQLLPLAKPSPGLNLFLVRTVEPGGLQVIGGGSPAAPLLDGSKTAGVALSMDTLCYRDWRTAARLVAHAFGRQMGLFRNREPDSTIQDPIADSMPDSSNLMFFGEYGGTEISAGQAEVLQTYPGLRE